MKHKPHCTLHRKKPDESSDRVVDQGTEEDMIRHFTAIARSLQPQYSMMVGGMVYSHHEIEQMARDMGFGEEGDSGSGTE
jgi:hypothetical protein